MFHDEYDEVEIKLNVKTKDKLVKNDWEQSDFLSSEGSYNEWFP